MEHFKCQKCNEVIGSKSYHLVNKVQHCTQCFETLFNKLCKKCSEKIVGRHISINQNAWHPDCFNCSVILSNFLYF